MAHIDALVDKVGDAALREALRAEVDTLLNKRAFGLVFQEHKPETVELPNYLVSRGCRVSIRSELEQTLWKVESISDGIADLSLIGDSVENRKESLTNLVVVREFGEAIYPGLKALGRIERGGDKPFHTVINAENYHAIETLLYAYEGCVDLIYIDPPYNSGAKDWKYNNDYVDRVDRYRHSKWLAFMQRRLQLARRLLSPSGVMIVTIDEHEVHHLGVLLEKIFPDYFRQMVTIVINPKGVRQGFLTRVEEYALYCFPPGSQIASSTDDLLTVRTDESEDDQGLRRPRWNALLRSGHAAQRQDRERMFYPIWVDPARNAVIRAGDYLPLDQEPNFELRDGHLEIVWPVRTDGSLGRWGVGPETLNRFIAQGFVALGNRDRRRNTWSMTYLPEQARDQLLSGLMQVQGFDRERNVVDVVYDGSVSRWVKTVWHRSSHDAGAHGTDLLRTFLGERRTFPFPKSLYAVEDALRVAVGDNPNALVLDFFAGSGTTAHAVMRLNAQDDGRRRSILVTNNEVSVDEALSLRERGLLPGDPEWESFGIFHHITRPRLESAVDGRKQDGTPVAGTYLDGTAMSRGFPENIEFFDLTYEDPDLISLGQKFAAVAPLLWLKAGGQGNRIADRKSEWEMPEGARYGVLFEAEKWRPFVEAVKQRADVGQVFVVTDSPSVFQQVVAELPSQVKATQLYDDYLRTFQINVRSRS